MRALLGGRLYILYTNICQRRWDNRTIIKYADDSLIVILLKVTETGHGQVINDFVEWCEAYAFQLNITKTKYMLIDFRKEKRTQENTLIKGQTVHCVKSCKYLGTIIDSKPTFESNSEAVCKKGHQHLFCIRKLSRVHIDKSIMTLFYHAFIESVL